MSSDPTDIIRRLIDEGAPDVLTQIAGVLGVENSKFLGYDIVKSDRLIGSLEDARQRVKNLRDYNFEPDYKVVAIYEVSEK